MAITKANRLVYHMMGYRQWLNNITDDVSSYDVRNVLLFVLASLKVEDRFYHRKNGIFINYNNGTPLRVKMMMIIIIIIILTTVMNDVDNEDKLVLVSRGIGVKTLLSAKQQTVIVQYACATAVCTLHASAGKFVSPTEIEWKTCVRII